MKRFLLGLLAVAAVGTAVALSDVQVPFLGLKFATGERNPVTHLNINPHDQDFQFAIVSDRTGGHRANVFSQAVEKLNLLQPAFVISVGDLIEGGKKSQPALAKEWQEFDGFVKRLDMPFFYVPGNHDAGVLESSKVWEEKLGRTYYHFLYKNVLFLMLNSNEPAGKTGNISPEEIIYAQKVLKENANVRWTIVVMHHPLWAQNIAKNGWAGIEQTLEGRKYTVFAGHVHTYRKTVRQGMNHYQLATTGGGSLMRGLEHGEFDHVVWATMTKEGPLLANIMLDGIQTENLQPIKTVEPAGGKKKPTYPVRGIVYFEGSPAAGATVFLQGSAGRAVGSSGPDGSFQLTTYTPNDGAIEGEYNVTVTWKQPIYAIEGKYSANLLSARYADAKTSGLKAVIRPDDSNELVLNLKK